LAPKIKDYQDIVAAAMKAFDDKTQDPKVVKQKLKEAGERLTTAIGNSGVLDGVPEADRPAVLNRVMATIEQRARDNAMAGHVAESVMNPPANLPNVSPPAPRGR
jgi:hypothetical protein